MSYQNSARLSFDSALRDRCLACSKEQALVFKDDGRADIAALAVAVIADPGVAQGIYELVIVEPDFRDVTDSTTVTDAVLLSAVQAVWPTYADALYTVVRGTDVGRGSD